MGGMTESRAAAHLHGDESTWGVKETGCSKKRRCARGNEDHSRSVRGEARRLKDDRTLRIRRRKLKNQPSDEEDSANPTRES